MEKKLDTNNKEIQKWIRSKKGAEAIDNSIERACAVIANIEKSQQIDPSKLKERFTL